jgi:hypothetical protein
MPFLYRPSIYCVGNVICTLQWELGSHYSVGNGKHATFVWRSIYCVWNVICTCSESVELLSGRENLICRFRLLRSLWCLKQIWANFHSLYSLNDITCIPTIPSLTWEPISQRENREKLRGISWARSSGNFLARSLFDRD